MKKRVVVWGTGNVGRPAIRAVLAHRDLELVGVIVSDPAKVGRDAGEIAGVASAGVAATADWQGLLQRLRPDALVYTANADIRGAEAFMELLACLEAGVNVVSPAFYPLLYPECGLEMAVGPVRDACRKGNSSVFVSGIDPGWAMDILPLLASGVVADIREIRAQEIFNYGLYDQPRVVREVIGFGQDMAQLPRMLEEFSLRMVWEPMVRIMASALDYPWTASRRLSSAGRWSRQLTCRAWVFLTRAPRVHSGSRCGVSATGSPGWWWSTSPASMIAAHPTGPIPRTGRVATRC